MSQLNSMAIPMEGKYSKSELLELKNKMNAKALAKRRSKTALRLAANIIFAILVLLPLLYAVSIALMPSNELFTTDLNLFPKHPTLQNFKEAFTTVPLLRFILNSFIMAGCITIGQIISCSLAAFAFSFLEFKGKGILFAIVMATMMVPGEATIISNYLTVGSWGILDTYAVLIIPYLTSVMYVDEVKGIEFDKVFVVSAAMHRNEKYIAYTRALSELIVVVDEKLMNNNSAKKVKENIEHNKKAGIHSAKMTGTLKWEKTKQPKAYTLEKTIDNDVITYHFTENTKSIIKNEFANTDSILPSSIASSPLTNIKKNIYAHCVYIENSICYNINCKENMGKKCNKEGNCDYYISLPVPPDEEELIAEDIDNAKKYLAKYS